MNNMEGAQKQEEMFEDIAKAAEKDIITERRKRGKKISGIIDTRKLGRYIGARQKEKKELELQNIRNEILKK